MSIVITDQGATGAASGTSLAVTLTSNIAAGSSIVVAGTTSSSVGGTIADDVGNTYTLLRFANPNGNLAFTTGFWVCHNCIAINSGQKVTWSRSPSNSWVMAVGSLAGGPFATDINLAPVTGLSPSPFISSGVLGSANEAVFAVLGSGATAAGDTFNQVSGWAAPFATQVQASGAAVRGGSIVVSSTNSLTYNPTITSRPWALLLASFKISSTITPTHLNADGIASVNFTGNEIAQSRLNADGVASTNFSIVSAKVNQLSISISNSQLLSCSKRTGKSSLGTVTDNFNRVDGPVGSNYTQSPYNPSGYPLSVLSNQVYGPSGGYSIACWTANSFQDDQFAQMTHTSSGSSVGVMVRGKPDASSGYVGLIDSSLTGTIVRLDNGIFTNLSSGVCTGQTIRLEVSGSNLTLKANGVVVCTATDSTYTSGYAGIAGVNGETSDNWSAGPANIITYPIPVLIAIVSHSLLSVIKTNRLSTTNKILPFTTSELLSYRRAISKFIQFPKGGAGGFGIGFGRGFQTVGLRPSMTITVFAARQGFIFNRTVTFATHSLLSLKKSVSKLRSFVSQMSISFGRVFPKLIVFYPKPIGSATAGFGRGFGVGFQIASVFPSMTVTVIERAAKGRSLAFTNQSQLTLRKLPGKIVLVTNSNVLTIRRGISKIVLLLSPSTIRITSFIKRTISFLSHSVLNFSKSMSRTRIILSPQSMIVSRRIGAITRAFNTPQSTTLLRASLKVFNFTTISNITTSAINIGSSFLISLFNSQTFSISMFKPANTKTFNLITSPTLIVTRNISKTIALGISVIQNFVRLLFFRPIDIIQNQRVTSLKLFNRVFNFPTTVVSFLIKVMTKAPFGLQTQQIVSRLSVVTKVLSVKSSEVVNAIKQTSKVSLATISSSVFFIKVPVRASLFTNHSLLSLRASVSKVFTTLSPSLFKVTRLIGKPLLFVSRSSIILFRRLSTTITIVTFNIVSSAQGSKGLVVISTRQVVKAIKSTNKSVQTLLLPEQLTLQKSRDRILAIQQFLALTLVKGIARLSAYQTRVSQTFSRGVFRQFTIQTSENFGFLKSFIRTINLTTTSLVKVPQVIKIFLRDTQVITTIKISTKRLFTLQTEIISVGSVARTRLFVVNTGQSVVMKIGRISTLVITSVSSSVLSVVKTIRRTLKYTTTSAISVIAPRGYKITLQIPETVHLIRSSGRLFIAKIRESISVHRGANRIFAVATHQKVITGKLWKKLIISYSTGVTSSVVHKYGKVISIIQSTAISIYTKIRTLIQKAVILLVGA